MTILYFLCKKRVLPLAMLLCLAACQVLRAEQTDNHVLQAVPVPGAMSIDGKLDDWDLSGRVLICPDIPHMVGKVSAYVAMMYDKDALYVGVDCSDPTPLVNNYDPDLDIDRRKCFHSDSIQLHFKTDHACKVIGWWYTKEKRPGVISLKGWSPWNDHPIQYIDGLKELGITEAFRTKPDGSGYVQEMRIPWKAIVKSGRAYESGETFECMLDMVWGPDNGKGWPVAHMMDLVRPGATHTGWFWEVPEIYGTVRLAKTGNLAPQALPQAAAQQPVQHIPGSFHLRTDLPAGNETFFTLAVEDSAGHRIRTLPGECKVSDYCIDAKSRSVDVSWDCMDDLGHMAAPGEYKIKGLVRGALGARYDMCFYNPGTPPWATADGTGGWGADHTPPQCIAAAGDNIIVGFAGAEGGYGIMGLDAKGRKKWGEVQGATALAADDDFAYFMLNDFWAGKTGLARLDRRSGAYRPFTFNGKAELPVALSKIVTDARDVNVSGMAVHKGRLVLALSNKTVVVLNSETVAHEKTLALGDVNALAFASDGTLYALIQNQLHTVGLVSGALSSMATPGLVRGTALAIGKDGRIAVFDGGPDRQIKVYSAQGTLLYTIGKKSGRALRGTFDAQALGNVSSIAFGSDESLWIVENDEHPRRISRWDKQGGFIRDFTGCTAYNACGTFLHDQNPELAYSGPIEFELDRLAHTSSVSKILWHPDEAKGERFNIGASLATSQRFTSAASGQAREYLFSHSSYGEHGFAIFMLRAGAWQPVAAICLAGEVSGHIANGIVEREPDGEFAGVDAFDGCFWNDFNGDGIVQRNECEIIPAAQKSSKGKGGRGPFALTNGWGGKAGQDLSIFADGIVSFQPLSYSPDGAPRYGAKGMTTLSVKDRGDFIPCPDEKRLLILSSTGYGEESYMRALEYGTWRELWRYPSFAHGVHGSHHASMPEPGKIIGALKILGVAKLDGDHGSVLAIRGNLGQDFLMTTDGYYVGALFRDSRLPGPALPATEGELIGRPIENLTEGGEPFNGWFGRQSDGKIRMCTGIPNQAALIAEVTGLDTLRRFDGPSFKLDSAALVEAEQANAARKMTAAEPKTFTLKRLKDPIKIDGEPSEWRDIPSALIQRKGAPESAQFKLAYDAQNLYVWFEVRDATPWLNTGEDFARLFKTGDAVDLQFSTSPGDDKTTAVGPQHVRLLFAALKSTTAERAEPVCVLMKPFDKSAPKESAYRYHSPVGDRFFDRVERLDGAHVAVKIFPDHYHLEAAIPLSKLNLAPRAGLVIRGDAGFISSDANGRINVARTYWSNPSTNLNNDMPTEAWLFPQTWGEFRFE